jgi:diguanylate cyclase (GGDEF)-like protein/PAS domain S-box-containing protein
MPTIFVVALPEDKPAAEGRAMSKTEVFGPDSPLYNSRIILAYVKFIKAYHDYVDVDELLSYAGMHEFQVRDEHQWFTQIQVNRFYERLIESTGDRGIARKVGRYATQAECLGPLRSYAAGLLGPASFCEFVGRGNSHFSRSCTMDARQTGPGTVEATSRPKPGVEEQPFQCENRIGAIEGCLSLLKDRLPTVEETECIFRGGECCRYVIKWPNFKSSAWRKRRNWALVPVAAASAPLLFFSAYEVLLPFLAVSLAAALILSLIASSTERREFVSILENQRSLIDRLLEKENASDNNARMTQEIGQVLTAQDSVPAILREVARILARRLDYDRGVIFLADKEKGTLETREAFGYSRKDLETLNNGMLSLEETGALPVKCFGEKKPFLVDNFDEIPHGQDGRADPAGRLGMKASICCPIACAEEVLGVLTVGNITTRRPPLQSDIDLLMLVGQEIGVAIQNLVLKRTEKALRESGALFQAVVEKSGEVLFLTGVEGKIRYISPPVTDGMGYDPSSLIGKEAIRLVHPDDLHAVEGSMAWIRRHPGAPRNVTARVRHEDGSWRWVEITVRNLLSEPGVGAIVSNLRDITDRKKAQEALEESENKFKDLVEKAIVGVYLTQDGVFEYVNSKCAEIHGYARPDDMDGLEVRGTIFPEDLPDLEKTKDWVEGGGETRSRRFRILRKDGQVRHVETYGRYTTYRGKPAVIGMIVDVTDRRNAEHALLWKTTFLEALVDSSRDGILVLDNHMHKVAQNERLVDMWKMPPEIAAVEDEEERVKFLMASIKDPGEFYKKLMQLYNRPGDTIRCEFELNDGTSVEALSYPVLGKDNAEQYGRIWLFRDITELRNYWDMLEDLSTTDGLTGVSNRRRLDEFLEHEWRRSMRDRSELSLLLVDIDYFKQFNDRYGHLAGDDCLMQVAAALKNCVRRTGDFVARYGGEEFACVLLRTGEKEARKAAQRIMDEIAGLNIVHEGSTIAEHLTVSIGVATVVPEKGQGYPDLIGAADRSLYAAKDKGRNRMATISKGYDNEVRSDANGPATRRAAPKRRCHEKSAHVERHDERSIQDHRGP